MRIQQASVMPDFQPQRIRVSPLMIIVIGFAMCIIPQKE